jgi:hypothetical protein
MKLILKTRTPAKYLQVKFSNNGSTTVRVPLSEQPLREAYTLALSFWFWGELRSRLPCYFKKFRPPVIFGVEYYLLSEVVRCIDVFQVTWCVYVQAIHKVLIIVVNPHIFSIHGQVMTVNIV